MDQFTTMSSVRNVNGRARLVIVLLAMALSVGLLALHWILNRPGTIDLLSRELEQRTGLSLSVEGWHVELFPSIRLEMRGAHVHDRPNATPFFTADRLEIALGWLPLLEGRLVGKDVVLDRPRLTVRRSADRRCPVSGPGSP